MTCIKEAPCSAGIPALRLSRRDAGRPERSSASASLDRKFCQPGRRPLAPPGGTAATSAAGSPQPPHTEENNSDHLQGQIDPAQEPAHLSYCPRLYRFDEL